MIIREIPPGDHNLLRLFMSLPKVIYHNIPQWVPPLSTDTARIVSMQGNTDHQQSPAAYFLALDANNRPLGRVVIIINQAYNQYNHERTAFFFLFECRDDPVISTSLFEEGFAWAKKKGINRVIGPKGFSALDGLGLLTKGFEHRPAFGIPYNPPYYSTLIEIAGFRKQSDIVSGYLSPKVEFPQRIHQVSSIVQKRRGLHIARFEHRRQLKAFVSQLKDLYNNSLSGTAGNAPLTDQEANSMANQLIWFADPKLIKVVMRDNDPVGFLFAYPDISAAVQRTGGKVFPFGWAQLLREISRTKWVNINGAGIIEQYRGLGGTAILFSEMQKSIVEGGFEHADLVQIGTENDSMQRELRDLGIDFYKTHTVYERLLN